MTPNTNEDWLREKLATIEHERWADWQKWVHAQMTDELVNGIPMFCLPIETVVRWQKQIKTPYAQLSSREKASDMEQVDRYWPLIQSHEATAILQAEINQLSEILLLDVPVQVLRKQLIERRRKLLTLQGKEK